MKICFVLLILFLPGCTQVQQIQHLDELLTLKGYSDEKEAQEKWVQQGNKQFERLLAVVKDGTIKQYSNQEAILKQFGNPILTEVIQNKSQSLIQWLYRHPIQKLATDRVYLYFDADGHLVKFETLRTL